MPHAPGLIQLCQSHLLVPMSCDLPHFLLSSRSARKFHIAGYVIEWKKNRRKYTGRFCFLPFGLVSSPFHESPADHSYAVNNWRLKIKRGQPDLESICAAQEVLLNGTDLSETARTTLDLRSNKRLLLGLGSLLGLEIGIGSSREVGGLEISASASSTDHSLGLGCVVAHILLGDLGGLSSMLLSD